MRADEIMTTNVATISTASSVRHAIETMVTKGLSGLPVIDDDGAVAGMLTEGDLLRRVELGKGRGTGAAESALVDLDRYIRSNSWRIADLMSTEVFTVGRDAPIGAVAELMFNHKIKRVPVVENGALVGIISRVDLLRAIVDVPGDGAVRGDEPLAVAIRARLRSDLGLDLRNITVTVEACHAVLEGKLKSELERRAIKVLMENINGVESYVDRLVVEKEI
ncbi:MULTISPECIES: CBS domain-containing protein [unclassified Sinorhizobium]|uniref:CBS domain-containing protein n=1 Tax=unclassified Sinorhizobium TaxID=2613772 RepID=UPI0024C33A01|nr:MULTISPECIES: CBS domain-containing protein [unclassified Sinorhizobium]MDK1378522.1 CBS domain-containing protein [Sinorhizobium sp. 6-70]MDK1480592.1 CBS domain-containing protein [Sinorhizobium sp. 6-117]